MLGRALDRKKQSTYNREATRHGWLQEQIMLLQNTIFCPLSNKANCLQDVCYLTRLATRTQNKVTSNI